MRKKEWPGSVWDIAAELEGLERQHLLRDNRTLRPAGGMQAVDPRGRRLLHFCGNDYLGLARHPDIAAALCRSAARETGSGAAHLVSGHRPEHGALQEALADWLHRDRVLLFSTGYMANLGVIAGLLGKGDLVVQDRLNHASLLDGGLLSGARMRRYRHRDTQHLQHCLETSARRRLVVTDGVFSMDGDQAPVAAIRDVARRNAAAVLVDDAHGLGVAGPEGRGVLAEAGLNQDDVPLLVGTFGKAFGTFGAFVAGPSEWIELVLQRARTYRYTTASPPCLAAATSCALGLVRSEEWRREHLAALISRFRRGAEQLGLRLLPSQSPIQPIIMGSAAAALEAARALEHRGVLVTAIRPPTVPQGSARLRITLSAGHTEGQVDRLLGALEGIATGTGDRRSEDAGTGR